MTGSAVSAPSGVVQSTTTSPGNSCPASEASAARSRDEPARERDGTQRLAQHGARPEHRPAAEHRRPRRRGLAGVELVRRIDHDPDPLGRDTQLLRGELAEHGVAALPHLGPGVEQRQGAVGLRPEHRSPALDEPVADAGVLGAARDPRVPGLAVGVTNGEQRRLDPHAGSQPLARPELVADVERVAPPDLPAVDAGLLGEHVQHALERERRLVDPEPAHRARRRVVGVDGARLDVHVGHAIRPARVAGGPLQDLATDARVRPVVTDDARPDGDQVPVRVAARGVVEPHRVALDVEPHALAPGEPEHHRAAGAEREQGRLALDVEVLLAAEPTARRHLRDEDLGLRERQERGDLAAILPGALALGPDVDGRTGDRDRDSVRPGGAARHGQARLGLEERVLDGLGPERCRRDVGGGCQRGIRVASAHDGALDEVAARVDLRGAVGERIERVGHRRQRLELDIDHGRRLARRLARLRGDRGQHVPHVAHRLALGHEQRPVGDDQALLPPPGHVRGRHDSDDTRMRGGPGGVDATDDGARDVREAQRPLEHRGRHQVPGERQLAQGQRAPFVPGVAIAAGILGRRLAPPVSRDPLDRLDDRGVPRAPAQVPGQRPRDGIPIGRRVAAEQRLGLHHDPGRAVPALRGAGRDERVGEGLAGRRRQPFQRLDRPPGHAGRRLGTGHDRPAIDDHGARTARTFGRAAVLHRSQAARTPQDAEQRFRGRRLDGHRPAVEREVHSTRTAAGLGWTVWP